jgi:hypothetical protein
MLAEDKLERNLNGESKNEKIHHRTSGGCRPGPDGHGGGSLHLQRLRRLLLPLRLQCRLLLT